MMSLGKYWSHFSRNMHISQLSYSHTYHSGTFEPNSFQILSNTESELHCSLFRAVKVLKDAKLLVKFELVSSITDLGRNCGQSLFADFYRFLQYFQFSNLVD